MQIKLQGLIFSILDFFDKFKTFSQELFSKYTIDITDFHTCITTLTLIVVHCLNDLTYCVLLNYSMTQFKE